MGVTAIHLLKAVSKRLSNSFSLVSSSCFILATRSEIVRYRPCNAFNCVSARVVSSCICAYVFPSTGKVIAMPLLLSFSIASMSAACYVVSSFTFSVFAFMWVAVSSAKNSIWFFTESITDVVYYIESVFYVELYIRDVLALGARCA